MNSLFKTLRVAALAAAVLPGLAVAAPSAQDTERAKQTAAGVANTLANTQFNINSSQGTGAVGKPNTEAAMRNSLTQFQGLTGVTGVEQVSSHTTSGSKTSMSNIVVNATQDFTCSTPNSRFTAAGLYFKVESCDTKNYALRVSICDNATRSGLCSNDADYKFGLNVPHNAFTEWNGMQIGNACNSTGKCRITVKGKYTIGGNDQSLNEESTKLAISRSSNSISSNLSDATTKNNYAGKVMEYGKPLKECSDRNAQALDKGEAINCGEGGETVSFTNSKNPNANQCKTNRKCIKYDTSTIQASKTCTRSFDLTERVTQLQYNNYAVCTVTEKVDPKNQQRSFEDSCSSNGEDQRAGKTRIADSSTVCTKQGKFMNEKGEEYGGNVCLAFTHTEYWMSVNSGTVLKQVEQPTKVTGICAPASGNGDTLCPGNNWFGRLLPASACKVAMNDDLSGPGTTNIMDIDYRVKSGCGVCMAPTVSQICYGAPLPGDSNSTCNALANNTKCVMTNAEALTLTGEGSGLVASQLETYSCPKEVERCVQWEETKDGCYEEDMAQGLDKLKFQSDGYAAFANALVAAGQLDSVAANVEPSANENMPVPKIFNGDDRRCDRAAGGMIGNLLSRNCCREDLERPKKGQLIRAGCDIGDVELAAARRSKYTHYIGEYCSKKAFWGSCLRKTETYCKFPGMLPRLVHEQGREQLLAIASNSTGQMQYGNMNFRYYDTGNGSWSPEVSVNGNRVRAWQWPSYCTDPDKAGKMLINEPNANECSPSVTTWFAVCTTGNCENLTHAPEHGALQWDIMNVNPLDGKTTAINRFTLAQGGCTADNNCRYQIKAWPLGVGGKVVVTKSLTWSLYSETQETSTQAQAQGASNVYQMANVGDFMFKGYSMNRGAGAGLPASVRLDFSSDGGQTWTSFQVPTNNPRQEMALGTSGVTIIGSCDVVANMCGYSATGTTTVTAKPWGSAKSPDCSGFTAGQLAALDFGKMDLSEWLATVIDGATGEMNQDALVEQAKGQFEAYNSIYSGGEVTQSASSTRAANFARVVPSEGFGPFTAKLVVSGVWPEATGNPAVDTNLVTRVTVDWGDCSVPEEMARIPATEPGNGFRSFHRYEPPDSFGCLGNPTKNVTHKIKLTAHTTQSGTQTRTLSVENAWSVYPGGKHNNDYTSEVTTAKPGGDAPASPTTGIHGKK